MRLHRSAITTAHATTTITKRTKHTTSIVTLCSLIVLCVAAPGLAVAQVRNWPSEGPPRPLPARDSKFPPYELQTLPNGLQVVAVLHHEQPVVSMRLLIRAGAAADPREKLGAARLAASLLDQGTTTKSAEELADAIDFIGGVMGAGAGTDLTQAHMVVMKDSFETGMRMLSDIVRNPAFARQEIDRQRQQMLSGLQVSVQDPEYVANSVFDRLVYGFHPYGLPDTGTVDTIAAISREDLVAFHSRYFAPNNAILAIVGDVTAEEAFTMTRKIFGDWEKRELPTLRYIEPPDPTRRVIIVNKPDAVQTEVRVGHLGVPRSHPDYMAINLAIRILGGEGSNRLHQVLRTERGLTYGAQANMDALKVSGDFEAETNTRSEATGEVLRLIVDEFWRLQRERVGERELADAKAYMTGSFPLTIETPDSIAMQVVNVVFYGLPLEQLQTFRDRVNAVTVDDIQRVAREFLRPDRLSVVLVGNAAAFASQLRGVGFGTYETVELPELDLMSASLKRTGSRVGRAGEAGGAGAAAGGSPKGLRYGHGGEPATGLAGRAEEAGGAGEVASVAQPFRAARDADASVAQPFRAARDADAAVAQPFRNARDADAFVAQPFRAAWDADAAVAQPFRAARTAYTQVPAGARPPSAQTSDEIEKAKTLLAKATTAKGGIEKLRAVKTIVVKQTLTNVSAPRDRTIETTAYIQYPDRFRIETSAPGGMNVQGYDGTTVWAKDDRGVHGLPDAAVRDARTTLRRDPIALLLAASEGALTARVLPDVKDARGQMHRALEVSAPDFDPVVLLLDPETSQIDKLTFVADVPGRPIVEDEFADYRAVEGVQIAFQASRRNGTQAIERRITDVKINQTLDAALFKRPS
jgi:zinc protease